MSEFLPCCIYEEALTSSNTTLDLSSQNLEVVPNINNKTLCMLYLQNNNITTLSDDFFPSLPSLMWLDLRDNRLTDIPPTIQNHACLTHLLLKNNNLTSLPVELGSVTTLKVLQLEGNPLMFPPREIINAGTSKILEYLHKDQDATQSQSELSEDGAGSVSDAFPESIFGRRIRSYNSVIDQDKLVKTKTLSVKFNEKEDDAETEQYYLRFKGKCPKLAASRSSFAPKTQSAKYLKPLKARSKAEHLESMRRSFLRDVSLKKNKDLIASRDKIIQDRKNAEYLRQWRKDYREGNFSRSPFKMASCPYDTSPEYMTLLSREDIEKDLPDKYRRKLTRRCKPTVARKSTSDVQLALSIKKLFENLESIDVTGSAMTPRTEQKVLLNEIHKISEIKQKLMELSMANGRSVSSD